LAQEEMDSFQHKQQLRKEGKVEIPLMIDPSRYFIGNIRVKDVYIRYLPLF